MQLVTLIMHIYLNMTRSKQSIIIVIYSSPKAGRVNKVAKTQCQLITFTKLYSTLLLSLSYFKKKKTSRHLPSGLLALIVVLPPFCFDGLLSRDASTVVTWINGKDIERIHLWSNESISGDEKERLSRFIDFVF